MNLSDRVWTRSPSGGWCTRCPTAGDAARRALIHEWLLGEITFKQAADAIKARGITESECAP